MSGLSRIGKIAPGCLLLTIWVCLCQSAPAADSKTANSKAPKLVIVKAEYGDLDNDKTVDVTAKVASMVKENNLFVEVNKASLGAAPAGAPPKLKVGYIIEGIYRSKTADEGQSLDISTRLVIVSAVYGSLLPNGQKADVTDQVAAMVKKNRLIVEASNDNFGDPAEGTPKKLRVDYELDGVKKFETVNESQTITIGVDPTAKAK
jgi:hypothetical protein